MIGTLLANRYQIEAELGRGGMGAVYRAHDSVLHRPVAIKVLIDTNLGIDGQDQLLNEARAVARLDHPNIVTVYDAATADGYPYIAMQFVEGRSLNQSRPESIKETVAIFEQLCDALEHAHKSGIIHRDIKPENVIIAESGQAKLMDFGLARSVDVRLTVEGAIAGTLAYIARGQAEDLAAAGRLLRQAATLFEEMEVDYYANEVRQRLAALDLIQ